jgi:hypothetical protein
MKRYRRRSDHCVRAALRSPGRPPEAQRENCRQFWIAIASGRSSEDAAVDARVSPAVGVRWFRRRAACHQHISRSLQNLHQGATFRSPNVRRSPSCARRARACEPSLVSSIALHARSLVNSGAMRRPATALWIIEQPRHNGTLIGPPGGQSQRSWRLIRSCEIMCKTGLPV